MTGVAITAAAAVPDGAVGAAIDALPDAVRAQALRAERVTQLALAAAGQALAGAGLAPGGGEPRARVGIALGTAFGCFLTNAAYQRPLATRGPRAASPRLFAATVSNAAAGEVAIAYRLGGPAVTLTAGGAAGLLAVGHAADLVARGAADAMVAGGMDARGPALERWLSDGGLRLGEAPLAEGAAAIVLEAEPGRALGWVLGHAAGFLPPGDRGASGATIRAAIANAGIAPQQIARVALASLGAEPDALRQGVVAALGTARLLAPARAVETFAAAGPLALCALLAGAPPDAPVLVLHACASGHVAALVAARAGAG